MKYLIVGLGNIGAEYAETRHNIGFKVLDALAEASNLTFTAGRYGSTATLKYKGRTLILLKPSTYMKLSGKAVRYWLETLPRTLTRDPTQKAGSNVSGKKPSLISQVILAPRLLSASNRSPIGRSRIRATPSIR